MVVVVTVIYVYGGYDTKDQPLNDFWQYDIVRILWTIMETINPEPASHSSYWKPLPQQWEIK